MNVNPFFNEIELEISRTIAHLNLICPPEQIKTFFTLLFFRDGQITAILDQKNYVEELNRHLRYSYLTLI